MTLRDADMMVDKGIQACVLDTYVQQKALPVPYKRTLLVVFIVCASFCVACVGVVLYERQQVMSLKYQLAMQVDLHSRLCPT
jgi:hypothetical protein